MLALLACVIVALVPAGAELARLSRRPAPIWPACRLAFLARRIRHRPRS
jgi:hypothetical protein